MRTNIGSQTRLGVVLVDDAVVRMDIEQMLQASVPRIETLSVSQIIDARERLKTCDLVVVVGGGQKIPEHHLFSEGKAPRGIMVLIDEDPAAFENRGWKVICCRGPLVQASLQNILSAAVPH